MEGKKKIIFLSITIILAIVAISMYRYFKKDEIGMLQTASSPNEKNVPVQENIKEDASVLPGESEKNIKQTPPLAPPVSDVVIANTKNSIGINTRMGYSSAVDLIKNKGNFELRDMIFTKYFSEADKNKAMILFTFYLSEKNRETQIKYYIKNNKSIVHLQYDLNNSKGAAMSSVLKKTTVPQAAIDYGFEKAIAKIETNDDYLKIPNKISNFPWVSLNNGPNGWEFQTMVDAKGSMNNKEKYSFTVNLDKSQVFFERRF